MKMTIGDRIKQRRILCGISASELAALLGKNRSTIYRYENSDIENLPTDILEPLARVLCTSPAYLMGWTDDPTDNYHLGGNLSEDIHEQDNSEEDSEDLIILNRNAKKLTPENRKILLDMARAMLKEDFDE